MDILTTGIEIQFLPVWNYLWDQIIVCAFGTWVPT